MGKIENRKHRLVKEMFHMNTTIHMQLIFIHFFMHFCTWFLCPVCCSELIL